MPQYQGIWTLQDAARLQSQQQWATDPLYRNTTLLLQADNAANAAQNNTFLDSSANAFTITRNGNTTQGTFTPFSATGWSNFFNGTNAYLQVPDSVSFEIGSGDFTFESWIYLTGYSPTYGGAGALFAAQIVNKDDNSARSYTMQVVGTSSSWTSLSVTLFLNNTTAVTTSASFNFALNTWYHIAAVRSGTSLRLYVNGADIGGGTNSTTAQDTSAAVQIGAESPYWASVGYGYYFPGYLSNARIVKGAAVYTSNFTPSTSPLGINGSGTTALLTCQSNRFRDNGNGNSGSGFAVTVGGTPSVQPFAPFAPQFQYTPTVIGGSGYFDGSGDFLTIPANVAFAPGTGDFTIETWVYPTASGDRYIWTQTTSGTNYFLFSYNDTGAYFVATASGGGTAIFGPAVRQNAWNHIAVVRSSGTVTVYVNGVGGTGTSNTIDLSNTTFVPTIGTYNHNTSQSPLTGYLSSLRYVRGTAVYTGNFTPPTGLLSTSGAASASAYPSTTNVNTSFATSACSFLGNFTNAAITDGTMKNNLETVGNAQVSTSVVKYGSGSMYFDGTGDYLLFPSSELVPFASNERFTIEGWIYPTVATAGQIYGIYTTRNSGSTSQAIAITLFGTPLKINVEIANSASASVTISSSTTISANTWYHFAVVHDGSQLKLYVNGTSEGTPATTSIATTLKVMTIGRYYVDINNYYFNGYIDDLRITKGIARYTANFTPPQVALPRQ
jgi:hypothetical protein